MRLIGCDLHASQQSIAMLDRDTGEIAEKTLTHEGGAVREFYASIPPPIVVGIEATGSMGWFLRLMEELASHFNSGVALADTERAEELYAHVVSANYFSALGVSPHVGRFFLPDEDVAPG